VAEFLATLLFVFVGAGAVVMVTGVLKLSPAQDAGALVAIALAHGLAIATLVSATAKISGGHINPAVTFGAVVAGRMKAMVGVLYVGGQLLGAVVGAHLLKIVIAGAVEGNLGAHALNSDVLASDGAGLLVEIILTFVLVFTVFAVAMDPRGMGNLAPMAIGLAVTIDHFVGVPRPGPP
jgi:aquaporin TIP